MADYTDKSLENQTPQKDLPGQDDGTHLDSAPKPIQIESADGVDASIREEELKKEFLSEFQRWESWRRPYESLWHEIYRLFLSVLLAYKTPTRSKLTIPVVFKVLEAALPKLLNVIVAQRDFFEVIPDTDIESERDVADRIKKLILHQLDKAKFLVKFVDFLKQLLLYGTSYMYIYWKVKREWVWSRKPIRKDVSFLGFKLGSRIVDWEEKKSYEVTERRPEIDILDVLDVYPDPMAANEDEGKAVWIRTWVDVEDIKELGRGKYPVYANTDSPELVASKGPVGSYSDVRQQRYGARGLNDPMLGASKVELLARWGKCDLDGDGIKEETVVILANRRVILKAQANQFHHQKRPLIRGSLFPVPMEWFGIGLIEPVIPLAHELTTVRRQRLDNINLILNRMWKVNSLADVDMETLISSPNNTIITDDMNAVEALDTPDVTQSSYNDATIIQADIEDVTAPRSIQGAPENGRLGRTARGAQLIIGQALEKFGTVARLTEEGTIKRMLELWSALNMQFIDSDDVLQNPRLYGGLFDPDVRVEDIRSQVRFRLTGSSELIDKEGKISQIISFFGIFKDFIAPETITVLMRKVWTLMGFDKKEIEQVAGVLPQPGAATSPLAPQTTAQNADAQVQGQITQNGPAAPISPPGARPTGGRIA